MIILIEQTFKLEDSCIVMTSRDNVATLLHDVKAGESISFSIEGNSHNLVVKQGVKFGHKVALQTINKGEPIIKYGESIGKATQFIDLGEHVHVQNLEGLRGRGDLEAEKEVYSQ
jgi:altronate dehydratase small subunit